MPMIISTVGEIMAREKRDMLFIRFDLEFGADRSQNPARPGHLAWFDAKGLRYEPAAPRGWLEGDPGIFAVFFDGLNDPRLAEYVALFEDANGRSLMPDEYQMVLLTYESWLQRPREPEEDQPDEGDRS